jgi:hypothetical protein
LLNSASDAAIADVTVQWPQSASPAMNDVLPGTKTEYKCVPTKASASIRVTSECLSNETDENNLQDEKQYEQRI